MARQRNIRLVVEYEGGGYHGWQRQPQAATIQQVLEERIERLTQCASRAIASGRTDAGVHALQQVVHFHTSSALPVESFQRGLNALLPSDIRVLRAEEVNWEFHARYSALGKRYAYQIWNAPTPSAFLNRYTWWIPLSLDVDAMEAASRHLVGRQDFSSFRSAHCDGKHPMRDVKECGWAKEGPLLVFWIEANGFLRYMVRSMVGTLVDVGMGKRSPEEMAEILMAQERRLAGLTAPARGLFLVSVFYPSPWALEREEPQRPPFGLPIGRRSAAS
jgi:tRNA pseudouridine38-40 synthase